MSLLARLADCASTVQLAPGGTVLSKGDVVLLLDDSQDGERALSFVARFTAVAGELGLVPKYYLTASGTVPRQIESEFLEDLRIARAIVSYLGPATSEANRASRILLNNKNVHGKHVLIYSNSEDADCSWLDVGLKSANITDAKDFEAALRRDLKRLVSYNTAIR